MPGSSYNHCGTVQYRALCDDPTVLAFIHHLLGAAECISCLYVTNIMMTFCTAPLKVVPNAGEVPVMSGF